MESTMCFFVAPPWVWFSQAGNLQPVHEQFFPMYLLSVPEALNFGGIFFWCLEMPEPMPIEWDLWVNAVKLFEDKILLASFGPKSCTGWFREYLYLIYHIYIYLFIYFYWTVFFKRPNWCPSNCMTCKNSKLAIWDHVSFTEGSSHRCILFLGGA